jgi:YD repeat-containing protein
MVTFATQDSSMKKFHLVSLFILSCGVGFGQYYQKDIVGPIQSANQWNLLRKNNIHAVKLTSFESNNQPSEGFSVEQKIFDNYARIETYTTTLQNGTSTLTSWYNTNGQLVKTVDTSEDFSSVSTYEYDKDGRISRILNTSSSAGQFTTNEVHLWSYDKAGKPIQMLRIRNGGDTTVYTLIHDEKGNVVEERGVRQQQPEPTFYYYYDDKNRLTDVVRYNLKAQRLLPTNIFSYDASGNLAGMLLVPEGSNDYQRWYYDYDDRGLKVRERAYNKKSELLGKVEYQYQ